MGRTQGGCLQGGGKDGEVRDPAAGDAEAEAQARTQGRDEDDVRQGGAGGSKARQQGGQGLPRQGPQRLHLRPPSVAPLTSALRPLLPGLLAEAVLLVVMPRRTLRPSQERQLSWRAR